MNKGYDKYVKNSVVHTPKEKLVILLVDGLVKNYKIALKAFDGNDIEAINNSLVKAQAILGELMASLDRSAGKWAEDLYSVYSYVKSRLFQANIHKDKGILEEVGPIIEEISETWHEIYKKVMKEKIS